MKKSILTFLCIACLFAGNVYGQSFRENQWSFKPRFVDRAGLLNLAYNALIGGLSLGLEGNDAWDKITPWLPASYLCIDGVSMKTPDGKVKFDYGNVWEKYYLWGFRNYSAGFEVTWQKRRFPIGAFLYCDYKHYTMDMKFPNETEYTKHITHSIVPALGIRCNFGTFDKRVYPVVEAGIAYNYNFKFKGKYGNDLKAVNNGIVGIYGAGVEIPYARMVLTIRYQMNHYNYFNEDYTPDNGVTYPYKGVKSTIGDFSLSLSQRF